MIIFDNNTVTAVINLTKGTTWTLPFTRPAGSTFPAFTSRTWTFNIFTQANETLIATGTVTVTDADTMSAVIPASVSDDLEWSGVKYGFNVKGTSGAIVDIPLKGSISVHRADG